MRSADSRISVEEGFGLVVGKVVVAVAVAVAKGCTANLFCSCLHTKHTIFLPRLYVCFRLASGWPVKIIRRDSEAKPRFGTAPYSLSREWVWLPHAGPIS